MLLQPVHLCLISLPGAVRDATCALLARWREVKLIAIAPGALSATHLLQRHRPELLLLDANLPDEEVFALLQWRMEHCRKVRCVVATTSSEQIHQALALGADAAIRRDELPRALLSHIYEWQDVQRGSFTAPAT